MAQHLLCIQTSLSAHKREKDTIYFSVSRSRLGPDCGPESIHCQTDAAVDLKNSITYHEGTHYKCHSEEI